MQVTTFQFIYFRLLSFNAFLIWNLFLSFRWWKSTMPIWRVWPHRFQCRATWGCNLLTLNVRAVNLIWATLSCAMMAISEMQSKVEKSESRLEPVLCLPKRILRSCNSIIQSLPSHFQIDMQADHRSDLRNIDRPERRGFCLPRFAAHTFRLDRPCCKHVQLQFIFYLGHEIYIEKVEAGGFGISVAKKETIFFRGFKDRSIKIRYIHDKFQHKHPKWHGIQNGVLKWHYLIWHYMKREGDEMTLNDTKWHAGMYVKWFRKILNDTKRH